VQDLNENQWNRRRRLGHIIAPSTDTLSLRHSQIELKVEEFVSNNGITMLATEYVGSTGHIRLKTVARQI